MRDIAKILTGLGFLTFLIYFGMGRDPIWVKWLSYGMLISALLLHYLGPKKAKEETSSE